MLELYTEEQIIKLKALLYKAKEVVIVSHTNPDGDAIGSALAMHNVLQNHNIKSTVILPSAFPEYYNFLYNSNQILIATEGSDKALQCIKNSDLIIAVDFNSLTRISSLEDEVRKSKAKKVLIDHHISPEKEAFDLLFSTVEISSASEYVYHILHETFGRGFLTKKIAECIYTGICTDTGSFSYSCNYPSTYKVIIHLMEMGIDGEDLHYKIYNTFSEKRLRLLGYCLSEKMKVLPEIGAAYISLSKTELQRFDFQTGDTEGIVNYTLMMNSVDVGVFIAEYPEKIRMSFRSKNNFDVNIFAKKYFHGGGHKKASGGYSYTSLEETIVFLEKALKESINIYEK